MKRFLSLTLAILMVVSLMPSTALAEADGAELVAPLVETEAYEAAVENDAAQSVSDIPEEEEPVEDEESAPEQTDVDVPAESEELVPAEESPEADEPASVEPVEDESTEAEAEIPDDVLTELDGAPLWNVPTAFTLETTDGRKFVKADGTDIVTFALKVTDNPGEGVSNFQYEIKYDPAVLTRVGNPVIGDLLAGSTTYFESTNNTGLVLNALETPSVLKNAKDKDGVYLTVTFAVNDLDDGGAISVERLNKLAVVSIELTGLQAIDRSTGSSVMRTLADRTVSGGVTPACPHLDLSRINAAGVLTGDDKVIADKEKQNWVDLSSKTATVYTGLVTWGGLKAEDGWYVIKDSACESNASAKGMARQCALCEMMYEASRPHDMQEIASVKGTYYYMCRDNDKLGIKGCQTVFGSDEEDASEVRADGEAQELDAIHLIDENDPTKGFYFIEPVGEDEDDPEKKLVIISAGDIEDDFYAKHKDEIEKDLGESGKLTELEVSGSETGESAGDIAIGAGAFAGMTDLETLNINNVDEVGNGAFQGNTNLKNINRTDADDEQSPDTNDLTDLSKIGAGAFAGTGLDNVKLGDNVTIAGGVEGEGGQEGIPGAFEGCGDLTSVETGGNTNIGAGAFSGNENLTDLKVGEGSSIGEGAFEGNSALTTVEIGGGSSIGSGAFEGAFTKQQYDEDGKPITPSVTIGDSPDPEHPTTIATGAFSGGTDEDGNGTSLLGEISIGSGANIGDGAFTGNENLTDLKVGEGSSIGAGAFEGSSGLTTVEIGGGSSIGENAFKDSFTDPKGTDEEGNPVTPSVTITDSPDAEHPTTIATGAFSGGTDEEGNGTSKLGEVNIGSGANIGGGAFNGNENLTDLKVGEGSSIGAGAFEGSSGLTTVEIGGGSSIGENAFKDSFTDPKGTDEEGNPVTPSVTIGNSPDAEHPTTIATGAFSGGTDEEGNGTSKLGEVSIGSGASIGDGAFNGNENLTDLKVGEDSTIGKGAFEGSSGLTTVEIGGGSNIGDNAFANSFTNPKTDENGDPITPTVTITDAGSDKKTTIGEGAFKSGEVQATDEEGNPLYNEDGSPKMTSSSQLGSVEIGNNAEIGKGAFEGNEELTDLTIGSGANIGEGAFEGNSGLTNVEIGNGADISGGAFEGAFTDPKGEGGEASVTIGSGSTIETGAFSGKDEDGNSTGSKLTNVSLGGNTTVEGGAFDGNDNLTNLEVGDYALIEEGAFKDNAGLTEVNIGKGSKIEGGAFEGAFTDPKGGDTATLNLGDNVKIEAGAFASGEDEEGNGTSKLGEVHIGSGADIGTGAFEGNDNLTDLDIGSNVNIGEGAFEGNSSLTNVDIGDGADIGNGAFENSFTNPKTDEEGNPITPNVTIGSGASIGNDAFKSGEVQATDENGDPVFNEDGSPKMVSSSQLGSVDIGDGWSDIGEGAFQGNSNLTDISLGNNAGGDDDSSGEGTGATIGNNAFNGTGITSIDIPEGVTDIGSGAFGNNENLTDVGLPTSLIGENEEGESTSGLDPAAFSGSGSIENVSIGHGGDESGTDDPGDDTPSVKDQLLTQLEENLGKELNYYLIGDLNADGVIDVLDMVRLVYYILKSPVITDNVAKEAAYREIRDSADYADDDARAAAFAERGYNDWAEYSKDETAADIARHKSYDNAYIAKTGDCHSDGSVTNTDLIALVRYLAGVTDAVPYNGTIVLDD